MPCFCVYVCECVQKIPEISLHHSIQTISLKERPPFFHSWEQIQKKSFHRKINSKCFVPTNLEFTSMLYVHDLEVGNQKRGKKYWPFLSPNDFFKSKYLFFTVFHGYILFRRPRWRVTFCERKHTSHCAQGGTREWASYARPLWFVRKRETRTNCFPSQADHCDFYPSLISLAAAAPGGGCGTCRGRGHRVTCWALSTWRALFCGASGGRPHSRNTV